MAHISLVAIRLIKRPGRPVCLASSPPLSNNTNSDSDLKTPSKPGESKARYLIINSKEKEDSQVRNSDSDLASLDQRLYLTTPKPEIYHVLSDGILHSWVGISSRASQNSPAGINRGLGCALAMGSFLVGPYKASLERSNKYRPTNDGTGYGGGGLAPKTRVQFPTGEVQSIYPSLKEREGGRSRQAGAQIGLNRISFNHLPMGNQPNEEKKEP